MATPSGERVIELGCEGRQARASEDRVFVACGDRGAVIVDLATDPARTLVLPQPSTAVGVFAGDGTIWVRLADGTARPLVLDPSAEPTELSAPTVPVPRVAAAEPPVWTPEPPDAVREATHAEVPEPPAWGPRGGAATARRAIGRVVQVQADRAQVRFQGVVEPGVLVEFSRTAEEDVSLTGARDHVVARGVVEAVRGDTARVLLETNTFVERGMHARAAGRAGGLWLLPPLAGGVFSASLTARTYLPIDTLALGVIFDLSVGYLIDFGGDLGLRVSAELTNVGIPLFAQNTSVGALGHGYVSFATKWFELGAGLGASTLSNGWSPMQTGFSFAQLLRIGAEDGLNFRFRTNVVIGQLWTGAEGWAFGDFYADTRIPLGHGAWLFAGGGGGSSGIGIGEAGVRLRMLGNGRGGSFFLSVGGGMGWLRMPNFQHAGPMVTIGIEGRP